MARALSIGTNPASCEFDIPQVRRDATIDRHATLKVGDPVTKGTSRGVDTGECFGFELLQEGLYRIRIPGAKRSAWKGQCVQRQTERASCRACDKFSHMPNRH